MTDRTDDFRLIAAALPPPGGVSPAQAKKNNTAGGGAGTARHQVSTLGEFHSAASSIAKNIHKVSKKLGRLSKLVQQRGLFNDPAPEINALVHDIKQEMQEINSELDASQIYVDRKKSEAGERSQAANHSVNVVGQLKTELMDTAKTFKSVLQQRSDNLKAQKDHREIFVSSQSSALALAPPAAYRPLGISPMKPQPENGRKSSSNGATGASSNGEASRGGEDRRTSLPRPGQVTSYPETEHEASADTPLIAPRGLQRQQQQQQQQQMQLVSGNQSYLESRSEAVQEVEGHIAELGLIFNKLATMLQDQREMVESIHDNVEDAGASVERGHLTLLSTLNSLNSNRRLALSVTGILVIFLLFFFVFIA